MTSAGGVDPTFINPVYSGTSLSDDITNTNNNLFGSGADPTSTSPVQSQAVIDAIHQAVHGGDATGQDVSTVIPNLSAIPQANIKVQASNSTTVTVDAAGTWFPALSVTGPTTVTGTHTIDPSADYLVVNVAVDFSSQQKISVNCGGVPMALLNSYENGLGELAGILVFGLASPPSGTQSIVISVSSTTVYFLGAASVSLIGVDSVGAVTAVSGTDGNPSMSVVSSSGRCIVQTFFNTYSAGSVALSSYTQTQLANTGDVTTTGSDHYAVVCGSALGAASVSFTATSATVHSHQNWWGITVEFEASSSAEVGSGLRQWRSLTTPNGGTAATASPFPVGFFDQTQIKTDDISIDTGGSVPKVYVTYAGWYMVKMNYLLASTSTNFYIRPVLYQNGTAVEHGDTLYVSTNTANFTVGDSFIVYCNAGDYLAPGYWCSTVVANLFTGESTGSQTYWEMALLNRSYM